MVSLFFPVLLFVGAVSAFFLIDFFYSYFCNDIKITLDPRYCRACEYDLHGNTTGICPECGNAIEPPSDETA